MIKAKDLFVQTRLYAGDMQKTIYADYEIIEAINASINLLASALTDYWSPEIARNIVLDVSNGTAKLPDGFLSVVNVPGLSSDYEQKELPRDCYRIEGENILFNGTTIVLSYLKHPGNIKNIENDIVDLNIKFLMYLSQIAAKLLKGEVEAANEQAKNIAMTTKENNRGIFCDPPMWGG